MYTVFELKSKKGGARQIGVDLNDAKQLIQKVDYQKKDSGEKLFYKVLSRQEKGAEEEFGQPYLKNVQLMAEVLIKKIKAKKIVISKRKAKKGYKKRQGYRHQHTLIKILG